MKKSVRNYIYGRLKNIKWNEDNLEEQIDPLAHWPDIKQCVESYYNSHPEMKQYHTASIQPLNFEYTDGFMKSLNKYCTTSSLKLKLIDALTKMIYHIPCSGLRNAPIKERNDLWHYYVSDSWRVFYHKKDGYMSFEEICPHKNPSYSRR